MTAPRAKYPRRSASAFKLTDGQRIHLLRGWTYFQDGFSDAETFKAAWALNADELMEEFRREHRDETFARPFGWWFAEHGKERPIINVNFTEADAASHRQHRPKQERFGYLCTALYGGVEMLPMQEEEWTYLERLDLLTNEEREFLATCAAETD